MYDTQSNRFLTGSVSVRPKTGASARLDFVVNVFYGLDLSMPNTEALI